MNNQLKICELVCVDYSIYNQLKICELVYVDYRIYNQLKICELDYRIYNECRSTRDFHFLLLPPINL